MESEDVFLKIKNPAAEILNSLSMAEPFRKALESFSKKILEAPAVLDRRPRRARRKELSV